MPLRQKIRFCTTHDGVRLVLATTGSGPPRVKASNWPSHLDFDLDSPVWDHLLEALSATHTVLRYDQRGSGLSDWPVEDISLEAWVRDLQTIVDAAGLERFPLLALSQGLPIAVEFLHRNPGRVTHLNTHGGYARGRRRRNDLLTIEEADVLVRLAELGWAATTRRSARSSRASSFPKARQSSSTGSTSSRACRRRPSTRAG